MSDDFYGSKGKSLGDILEFIKKARENPSSDGVWGFRTGFNMFDKATGGLQPRQMFIVAGVAGIGKSLFCLESGLNMAKQGLGGIYFSLEMSAFDQYMRLLSLMTGIPSNEILAGNIDNEKLERIEKAAAEIESLPIEVVDDRPMPPALLQSYIDGAKDKYNLGNLSWIVVDYLALLDERNDNEVDRVTRVAREVLATIQKNNLAGLVIHTLNKRGEYAGAVSVIYMADQAGVMEEITEDDQDEKIIRMRFTKVRYSKKHQDVLLRMKRDSLGFDETWTGLLPGKSSRGREW
mgnify:CR=1 FL=1